MEGTVAAPAVSLVNGEAETSAAAREE